MKKYSNYLLLLLSAIFLPLTLAGSCDSDGDRDDDNGYRNSEQYPSPDEYEKNARTITVNVDASELTYYDDITAVYGNDVYRHQFAYLGEIKVSMSEMPSSLPELKKLVLSEFYLPKGDRAARTVKPTDIHDLPFYSPALLVAALIKYGSDPVESKRMVNYIAKQFKNISVGAADCYVTDWNWLNEYKRSSYNNLYSYFQGATKSNGYNATKPYTMTMELVENSYATASKSDAIYHIKCSALDNDMLLTISAEDLNGDDQLDYFYPTTFKHLCVGITTYK